MVPANPKHGKEIDNFCGNRASTHAYHISDPFMLIPVSCEVIDALARFTIRSIDLFKIFTTTLHHSFSYFENETSFTHFYNLILDS